MKVTVCYETTCTYSITYENISAEQREQILKGEIPEEFKMGVLEQAAEEGDWDDEIWMEDIEEEEEEEEEDWGETETCPNCDTLNEFLGYSAEESGYIKTCSKCGKKMFLCDACFHSEDNTIHYCDWHKDETGRGCIRGWIPKGE